MGRPALLLLLVLAACQPEPSFDERYENAEADIRARSQSIDNDLQAEAENTTASSPKSEAPEGR